MFCIPTSPFISKFIITSSSSLVLTKQLYTPYNSALYIILATLNLIFDYPGLKFAIAVYGGLPTKQPLPYIPCILWVPYIPIQSGDII